jgi:Glycosidases
MNKLLPLFLCTALFSCTEKPVEQVATPISTTTIPQKMASGIIYEVNIRQHTKEGTIKAFMNDLPRLKELGVKMLWIMPVQPIGVKNRKEPLGSYYSIQDYSKVNPEFGTEEDFKALVNKSHELGLYSFWIGYRITPRGIIRGSQHIPITMHKMEKETLYTKPTGPTSHC